MNKSNDYIFSKLMTICVKEREQLIDWISKKLTLKLEIELNFNILRKEFIIRLSDEKNPFYLFMTSINEQQFNKIKSSENLLVDFDSFPQKLIDLFEICFDEQNKENPRFILTTKEINKELLLLEVIEMNAFKHLTHISLKIPAADQEFVKSSFSNLFNKLQTENERLESKLNSMESIIKQNEWSKAKELELIHSQYKHQLQEIELKYKSDFELKDESLNEFLLKERQTNANNKSLITELENVRKKKKEESERSNHMIEELNEKVVSLEKEIYEMELSLNKIKTQRLKDEELLNEKQQSLNECNESNKLLTQDLSKANEIIRKLQTEVQSAHQKLSLLNKVTSKQEEVVGTKQTAVKKLQSNLHIYEEELNNKEKAYESLRNEFQSLKVKCDESHKKLKNNENVILLLNKQISELQARHGIKSYLNGNKPNQPIESILPNVIMNDKQNNKTNPKTIAQRNRIFLNQ